MQYRDLLLALGLQEKIDIDQVLETGSCLVRMDHSGGKALELTLECDNERQVVWLYAPLGRVKAEARADVYGMLLRMHLLAWRPGARISVSMRNAIRSTCSSRSALHRPWRRTRHDR